MKRPVLKALAFSSVMWVFCCSDPDAERPLEDFIHADSVNHKFLKAGQERDAGRFSNAVRLYDSLLQFVELNAPERQFCTLSKSVSQLINSDTLPELPAPMRNFPLLGSLVKGLSGLKAGAPDLQQLQSLKENFEGGYKNTIYYLLTLEALSEAHRRMGSYIDSAKYYADAAIRVAEANHELNGNLPRLSYQLGQIAMMNRDAVTTLGIVEESLRKGPSGAIRAKLLLLKATALRKLERLKDSEASRREAELEIKRLSSPVLNLLVLRERALHGLYSGNEKEFFETMSELENFSASIPSEKFQADQLYGYYYLTSGDHNRALFHYSRSLDLLEDQALPDPTLYMEALNVLAELYLDQKKFDLAERTAYRALVGLSNRKHTPYTWDNVLDKTIAQEKYNFIDYEMMARIYLKRFEWTTDKNYLAKALRLYTFIDSTMQSQITVTEEEAVLRFTEIGHDVYAGGIRACYHSYKNTGDPSFMFQAHEFMERSKALIMYRDLLIHDETYFPEVTAEVRNRELHLKSKLASIKHSGKSHELSKTLGEFSEYYKELEIEHPEYFAAKYRLAIHDLTYFKKLAKQKNLTILQYHLTHDRLYLLKYDDTMVFTSVEIPGDFTQTVNLFRKLISTPPVPGDTNSVKQYSIYAHYLFNTLIAPAGEIKKHLLIVPEGALAQIPFECLISAPAFDFKGAAYFVKTHFVAYAHSLKTANFNDPAFKNDHVIAFAFNEKKERYKGKLSPLPGAVREVSLIGEHFPEANLVFGNDATKERFLDEVESDYDVVHVAMHASSNPSSYLDNKIYFRKGNVEVDTLYGYQISPLKVRAHTILLTACETASGATIRGEGTFSLTRSFLQAGARNVVSSMWSLSDYSAAKLTEEFYKNAKAGMMPALALGSSKRKYLEDATEVTAAPFYWSSLVCYGF
jgi:CHAT domain-containing protein